MQTTNAPPFGSHPSWVCGLKLTKALQNITEYIVTPFVGVWIETTIVDSSRKARGVTPFVGVWIET